MADVKWIKITTDIFDDEKILLIESLPDAYAIIVVWFKLLCLAGKQNNSGVFMMNNQIAYTDQMLATIFRMKENTVRLALNTFQQFGMVEIIDGVITIPNWGKHQNLDQLESKKAYMRNYMKEYREKQKALTSGKPSCKTNSKSNVSEADKEEEKEREKDKELYISGDDVYAATEENSISSPVEKLKTAVSAYSHKYFGRPATDYEQEEIQDIVAHMHQVVGEHLPPFRFKEDEQELLRLAFEAAAKAGAPNVGYINGVFRNMWNRGIHTERDYYEYEVKQDNAAGIM